MERFVSLPAGGKIYYRIPNVIEQLRFFSESKWFDSDASTDYWMRMMRALEVSRSFVVRVEDTTESIDDILDNRDHFDCIMEMVRDVAGVKKQVTEEEKKP